MIRGMTYALMGAIASIGGILYLQAFTYVTEYVGRSLGTFGTLAALDLIVLLFILLMIFLKKFGHGMEGEDNDEEDSGIEDVPHNKELNYNRATAQFVEAEVDVYEDVNEVAEELEASSRASVPLLFQSHKDTMGSMRSRTKSGYLNNTGKNSLKESKHNKKVSPQA